MRVHPDIASHMIDGKGDAYRRKRKPQEQAGSKLKLTRGSPTKLGEGRRKRRVAGGRCCFVRSSDEAPRCERQSLETTQSANESKGTFLIFRVSPRIRENPRMCPFLRSPHFKRTRLSTLSLRQLFLFLSVVTKSLRRTGTSLWSMRERTLHGAVESSHFFVVFIACVLPTYIS